MEKQLADLKTENIKLQQAYQDGQKAQELSENKIQVCTLSNKVVQCRLSLIIISKQLCNCTLAKCN